MEILTVGKKQIRDLSRIYALSWKTAYRGMVPDDYLDQLKEDHWVAPFETWLEGGKAKIFLCLKDGIPIGGASCFPSKEEAYQGWGELQSLYVLPAYFKMGCGKALLEAVEENFQRQGISKYYLWVLRENKNAQGFYSKMGFCSTDEVLQVEMQGKLLTDYRWVKELERES